MSNQKKILILSIVFLMIGGIFVAKRFGKKEETKIAENVNKNEKKSDKKEVKTDESNAKNNDKKDEKKNEKTTKNASYPLDADENINFEELKAMGRPIIIDFSQAH